MKQRDEKKLERWAERELARLPELEAPGALLHRVMLAVHERERRPWWKRAWPEWPPQVQLLSVVILALVAGVVLLGGTGLLGSVEVSWRWTQLEEHVRGFETFWGTLQALGRAGGLLLKSVGYPFLMAGVAMVLLAYGTSVGLLTACYRLANQRA